MCTWRVGEVLAKFEARPAGMEEADGRTRYSRVFVVRIKKFASSRDSGKAGYAHLTTTNAPHLMKHAQQMQRWHGLKQRVDHMSTVICSSASIFSPDRTRVVTPKTRCGENSALNLVETDLNLNF